MIAEETKKALLKLFLCYNWAGDDGERKAKFNAYCETLSSLPPKAVVIACAKGCRGGVGVPGFLPTAGELYRAAVAVTPEKPPGPPKIDRKISPAEQERVALGMKKLAAELKASGGQGERFGSWQSLGRVMNLSEQVLASDELRKKLAEETA